MKNINEVFSNTLDSFYIELISEASKINFKKKKNSKETLEMVNLQRKEKEV